MPFYSAMGSPYGGLNFGGMGGNPSAFSAGGGTGMMDPMTQALLFRMQNANLPGTGSMAPQIPAAQPLPGMGGPMGGMPGGGAGAMPAGAGGSPAQGNPLASLLQNPQALMSLLGMLRGGQGGGYTPGIMNLLGAPGNSPGTIQQTTPLGPGFFR